MIRQKIHGNSSVDPKKWIEERFLKCECMQFVADPYDDNKCGCGRDKGAHDPMPYYPTGTWSWKKNACKFNTDAYGVMEFGNGVKSQYLRMSPGAKFDDVIQLFTSIWGVEPPKLLISVHGGMTNFDLHPRLRRGFRRSLQRMAAVPGVWILTTGLNIGVVKHVGDALTAGVIRHNRAVVIGVAPWGAVANRNRLAVRGADIRYYPPPTAPAATVLNPNHSFFLLIDDGTSGKYGAEARWRRNFEQYVARNVPLVALLVEGGANCIRYAVDYLTDQKPVVVVEGSGRAADILSLAFRQMELETNFNMTTSGVLGENEMTILNAIQKAFGISTNHNRLTLNEVILCTKRRELISVWNPLGETSRDGNYRELDVCVLSTLLRAQRRSAPDQLRLALAWNRVDLALNQIFIDGQIWPEGALNEAMMEALLMNRVEFVKVLLENGVDMAELMTSTRLEQLYNIKHPDTWLLRHLSRILIKRQGGARVSLADIGNIVDSLMGYGYRSADHYRPTAKTTPNNEEGDEYITMRAAAEFSEAEKFRRPFSDLFIWAVLMHRQDMAKLMWKLGEESLAKALVACRIYRSIASFVSDDVTSEVTGQLKEYSRQFADLAVELLDHCHSLDQVTSQQLLTYELHNFSNKTCLSLAVSAHHKQFVAHPCCQNLLNMLWMGGLRSRSSRPWKIVLSILCPPFVILGLEYLTQEELRLQPQTEQELEELRLQAMSEMGSGDISPTVGFYEDGGGGIGISNRFGRLFGQSGLHHDLSVRQRSSRQTINLESGLADQGRSAEFSHMLVGENQSTRMFDEASQAQSQILVSLDRSRFSALAEGDGGDTGRPLSIKTRFYEFYNAPVTKFWLHSIGYLLFVNCFSYTILTELHPGYAQWPELWITAYVATLLCDKFREIFSIDAHGFLARLSIFFLDLWNLFDTIGIGLFLLGLIFRWTEPLFEIGRALWIVAMVFFLIHTFDIFQAHEDLATYITILHKMLKRMISFLIILGVVIGSYGIVMQASRFPFRKPEWAILKDIFVESYFNLYGEVYHEYIDTGKCDSESKYSKNPYSPPCWCCSWLGPVAQTVYLIVANILMLNLLIAVFNNVFERVNRVSQRLTKFQRYRLIVDYQMLPIFPPPFILLSHLYTFSRVLIRRIRGRQSASKDPGLLKLVLSEADEKQILDFEEQARDEMMDQREAKVKYSSDELTRGTAERTEAMQMAMENMVQRQTKTLALLHDLEYRFNALMAMVTNLANAPEQIAQSQSQTHSQPQHQPQPIVASSPQFIPLHLTSIQNNLEKLIEHDDAAAGFLRHDPSPAAASEASAAPSLLDDEGTQAQSNVHQSAGSLTSPPPPPSPSLNRRRSSVAATSVASGHKKNPRKALAIAEEAKNRAIAHDVYQRLRMITSGGEDSEFNRLAKTLVEQEMMAASEIEEEADDNIELTGSLPSSAGSVSRPSEENWLDAPEEIEDPLLEKQADQSEENPSDNE